MSIFSDAEDAARDFAAGAVRLAEGMIRRAVISIVTDSRKQTELQVKLLDAEPEPAELWQQYGFTSHPPAGSEAIVLRVGGVAEHQIVIATAKRDDRPKVATSGDVKIYVSGGPVIHITGAEIRLGDGATKSVNRAGDDVIADTSGVPGTWGAWLAAVGTATGAGAPPVTAFGTTGAGSAVVKAVD